MKIPKLVKVLFLLSPIFSFGLGGACNQLVEIVNDGRMPVFIPAQYQYRFPAGSVLDREHVVEDDNTRLKFLDDRIWTDENIESVGDVFIDFGSIWAFPVLGLAAIFVVAKNEYKPKKSAL